MESRPTGEPDGVPLSRVPRPREEAARTYDRIAPLYDYTEGLFERRTQDLGVEALSVQTGERVLEIGPGTGRCLAAFARAVGPAGAVAGLDISAGMRAVAGRRLRDLEVADRVRMLAGDAVSLPFAPGVFDAAFMSFVLELFDSPDIPVVLGELRRVLRTGGRLGVVALATRPRQNAISRLYVWGHEHAPRLIDCRPIPVPELLEDAGFALRRLRRTSILGLPVDIALAERPS